MIHTFLKIAYEQEQLAQRDRDLTQALSHLPKEELYKVATGQSKLARMLTESSCDGEDWLSKFKGTPLFDQAIALVQAEMQLEMQNIQRREENREQMDAESSIWAMQDKIRLQKKMLELHLHMQEQQEMLGGVVAQGQAVEAAATPAPPPVETKTAGANLDLVAARMRFKLAASPEEINRLAGEFLDSARGIGDQIKATNAADRANINTAVDRVQRAAPKPAKIPSRGGALGRAAALTAGAALAGTAGYMGARHLLGKKKNQEKKKEANLSAAWQGLKGIGSFAQRSGQQLHKSYQRGGMKSLGTGLQRRGQVGINQAGKWIAANPGGAAVLGAGALGTAALGGAAGSSMLGGNRPQGY